MPRPPTRSIKSDALRVRLSMAELRQLKRLMRTDRTNASVIIRKALDMLAEKTFK